MAFTSPKSYIVGESVNAAMLNIYQTANVRATPHRIVQKLVTETLNNSTTLQDDNELFVQMGANETWYFRLFLTVLHTLDTVPPGTKVAFTVPAGATVAMNTFAHNSSSAPAYMTWDSSGASVNMHSATIYRQFDIEGIVITSSTIGKFQLQWAQVNLETNNVMTVSNHSSLWGMKLI